MTCCPWLPRRSRRSRSTRRSSAAASSRALGRRFLALALLGLALTGRASLAAHELGTIRIFVRFEKGGGDVVDAVVDRQDLPPGPGTTLSARPYETIENLTPQLNPRIDALVAGAINGAQLRIDGKTVRPRKWSLSFRPAGPGPFPTRLS